MSLFLRAKRLETSVELLLFFPPSTGDFLLCVYLPHSHLSLLELAHSLLLFDWFNSFLKFLLNTVNVYIYCCWHDHCVIVMRETTFIDPEVGKSAQLKQQKVHGAKR